MTSNIQLNEGTGVMVRKIGENKGEDQKKTNQRYQEQKTEKNLNIHTMNNDGWRTSSEKYICEAFLIKFKLCCAHCII